MRTAWFALGKIDDGADMLLQYGKSFDATFENSGCPIHSVYRTSSRTYALRLSDPFGLSDKLETICFLVVRFFRVIGQVREHMLCGCPILSGYRTSSRPYAFWLSDSFGLSDKFENICFAVVRSFRVIGQARDHMLSGCPILSGYRTSSITYALRLSDSFGLSDKLENICFAVVRFFRVIGQVRDHMLCGCPILSVYRTSSRPYAFWLSDSFGLSDKLETICFLVVRFFRFIGQAREHMLCSYPILSGYRTTYDLSVLPQPKCQIGPSLLRLCGCGLI
ncbi:hypothetical protein C8U37_11511 [Trichococcus patagoniensis]|uniref:Uncharacterized protein n=1 Tax=Trichococcus patagoniensis TaxID=382641 RepID=A0A2T5IGH5_9LACT|nr:hypothetical protein C8U37_11511 [Trichococcus patagoniensis]